MTNPAVAKWLAEIAAAKAKADAKKRTQGPAPPLALTNTSTQPQTISTASPPTLAAPAAPAASTISYGIITSYNLRTHQNQFRLVLPPEPHKPGPGECCGNDCDPCVNTLYYQDLEEYKQTVQELKQQYEQACSDLENGVTEPTAVSATAPSAIQVNNDEEKALSVRAYRPFKILKKQRLADNTLLIVCDTPSPSIVNNKLSTFHILIRLKLPQPDTAPGHDQDKDQDQNQSQKEQHFVTKAFTPVDLPTSHGKLAFLVKLYPAPHRTSEMFRALRVWSPPSTSISAPDSAQDAEMGVLYLRGPVRTGFDLDHQTHQIPGRLQLGQGKNKARRVVMIAAGSGVTPMYQILQQYHAELARRDQDPEQRSTAQGQVELDLIYCNRTRADIWLRQELHAFSASALGTRATQDGNRVHGGGTRTFVRVQHILSSTELKSNGLGWTSDLEVDRESDGHNVVTSSGRITPQILQATLTSRHSAWKAETGSDLAALSLGEEEPIQIVICGPEAFNRDVVAMLDQIGYWSGSGRCAIHVLE
ncbi:hypothetical protein BGZ82_003061 [Podila clonocystis]|nr:hypothetical protein BGZ82_003061 [Podila clonocystis]